MSSANQVLVEHFDSKFDLLLDGYAMTNKKIDDLKQDMNDQFRDVDAKFEVVFEVLDDLKNEVKSVKI